VFDLDNTLVRGSSLFHFGVYLARKRMVPVHHVLRFGMAEASYVLRRSEPVGVSADAAARALGLVAGARQDRLLDLVGEFVAERLPRILVPEVALHVMDFRRAGFTTVLATASPQELASAIAAQLGMSGAVGTVAETVDGRYSGRLVGPVTHGAAKAARVRQIFEEHGLDLARAWAFSDSVNDLPLLSMVGNPVATRPDADLRAVAQVNGWRVLDPGRSVDPAWEGLTSLFPFPH
jgi:HAD superfamily hydrolase (TIGR01490 family)